MNTPREFLHNHPKQEWQLGIFNALPKDHVIVDKKDWEEVVGGNGKPSLFVRFYRWMLENDTFEKAEQWANYEDEDMFRAFLIDQKLAR